MMKLPSGFVRRVFFSALIAAIFSIVVRFNRHIGIDPDQYYHFGLSRQMAEMGAFFLRKLPQVEGLGWGNFFVEKEFLFHQFTALGYRLGGSQGVQIMVWLLALSGITAFFLFASTKLPSVLAFLSTLVFFGNPALLFRLSMLRPHVLAIFFFLLLVIGILRRNRWLTAAAALGFTLSYHAIYIPLIVMGAAIAAEIFTERRLDDSGRKLYYFGFFGVIAGIFLNPYFPANLVSGLQIAYIPSLMAGELSSVGFGAELYPAPSDFLLNVLLLPLLTFIAAVWRFSADRAGGRHSWAVLFLFGMSGIFLWMSFQSKRGAEYFIPACAFLFVELFSYAWGRFTRRSSIVLLVPFLAFVPWNGWQFWREINADRQDYAGLALDSVGAIPKTAGKKVFNCEWDASPYLFYARPDLRFIDILDPSLLYFSNSEAHKAREQLKAGEVADIYGLMKNSYGADYVLCRNFRIVEQLSKDARFRRLYPASLVRPLSDRTLYVYEIRPEPGIEYVQNYEHSFLEADVINYQAKSPAHAEPEKKLHHLKHSAFLHFGEIYKGKRTQASDQALCAVVRPTPAEMQRLAKSVYLAIGGGRNIRMWRNGVPIFDSQSAFPYARMHQIVVPLKEPIKADDRLEFIVCSSSQSRYWGFSLSGLTKFQLREICHWKEAYDLSKGVQAFNFELIKDQKTCLGPLALPSLDSSSGND